MFRLTSADKRLILVTLIVALVGIGAVVTLRGRPGPQVALVVKTSTGEYGPYRLSSYSEPALLEFVGPVGKSVLEVSKTGVRMVYSDCPDKICISMGTISLPGETIVCMPNRVFATIVEVQ
ncbi:MAG: NusG domain II-containing protein [Bacillota bacterium]